MKSNELTVLGKKPPSALPPALLELNYDISGAEYAYARGQNEEYNPYLKCDFKLVSSEPVSYDTLSGYPSYQQPVCAILNDIPHLNVAAFNLTSYLRKNFGHNLNYVEDQRIVASYMNRLKHIHPDAALAAVTHQYSDECSTYICCFPGKITKDNVSQPDADTHLKVKSLFFATLWHMNLVKEKDLFQSGIMLGSYLYTIPKEKRKLKLADDAALAKMQKEMVNDAYMNELYKIVTGTASSAISKYRSIQKGELIPQRSDHKSYNPLRHSKHLFC